MILCIPVQFICTSALSGWQLNIAQICTFLQMHMFIEEVGYLCRVHVCAICMKYSHVRAHLHMPLNCILSGQLHMHMFIATQLEMKWSGICALLSTGHRSNVAWHWTQCGTLWYTLAHFLILHTWHTLTLHTAHFGTGHWHTESSHRSSVAWQPPAETQHSESLLIDTLEPEFWKHKNHIGDRSCAKLFKSLCSKLQSHLGTY